MALRNTDPSSTSKALLGPQIFLAEQSVRKIHPYVTSFYEDRYPKAVGVVEEALKRYSTAQLAIAFNGGKDCTVLLDLVLKTIQNSKTDSLVINGSHSSSPSCLVVYFRSRPQFPILEDFIKEKVAEASQTLIVYDGDLKTSLQKFKIDHPVVEGIFMGTRCKDPSSKHLLSFSPTDPAWPKFTRILPILDFSYHDVWLYLKDFNVSYCKMYDEGYTSIGWEGNTFKNPKLKTVAEDGIVSYKPAFLLEDSDDERSSRE